MIITSRQNEHVKQIRRLRQRAERQRTGLFFVEGVRAVAEAIQLGVELEEIVVATDLLRSDFAHELLRRQERQGIPIRQVSADVFASLSERDHPQGLGAVARQRWERLEDVRPGSELGWVALDAVQDPGNLGTILRTSEAVGGAGIVLLARSTDPYDPEAVRASMGAIFSQRLVRTDAAALAAWARVHGLQMVGTTPAAPLDYQAVRYRRPVVLLMGSERQGLSSEDQARCEQLVSIPMVGRADSLNLAVATGIVLYEIFNQSRQRG